MKWRCLLRLPFRPRPVAWRGYAVRALPAHHAAAAASSDASQSCTFVCISDTHNQHAALSLPPGDVLLHAGDLTLRGSLSEAQAFAAWWHAQPHAQKVVVPGNHDFCFDADMTGERGGYEAARRGAALHVVAAALLHRPEEGSHFLLDSGVKTRCGGFGIWGAPWQPKFWGAFNLPVLGRDAAAKWALIPAGTDVVVTHGPAAGFLDFVPRVGRHVGCPLLAQELLGRVRPAAHVAGHIHEGYGVAWGHNGWDEAAQRATSTAFVNAASCTLRYEPNNAPLVFTLRRRGDAVECVVDGHEPPSR